MKLCPTCRNYTDEIKSVIAKGTIVTGCSYCVPTLTQGNELAAQNHRTFDRRDRRKSNVQPVEVEEYIAAYPEESREIYDEATLRKYGH